METQALRTPAIIVDLDRMERNIKRFQDLCTQHGKALWPMVKTHKSTEIARMQHEAGAAGFLCGTLDECEALHEAGFNNLMYAYPVAGEANIRRVLRLSKQCNFILRLDCAEQAALLDAAATAAGTRVQYTIIVDSGLHRFGVAPAEVVAFAQALRTFSHLVFKGISTHPGQVYAAQGPHDVANCAAQERETLHEAVTALHEAGFACDVISTGSTPTFTHVLSDNRITMLHPGNYVFFDAIQIALGCATPEDCALSVQASVISRPAPDRLLIDAGAKCLGLDQGAHGNGNIRGYGHIVGHPEMELYSLSEEVGKIRPGAHNSLLIGDIVRVVPNHACSSANLTSCLIGCRGGRVERLIPIDIRSNSTGCGAR